nr:hypothetical protein [Candidatus Sigynarchaeota archaeon]
MRDGVEIFWNTDASGVFTSRSATWETFMAAHQNGMLSMFLEWCQHNVVTNNLWNVFRTATQPAAPPSWIPPAP